MTGGRHQLIEHLRVGSRTVGGDFGRERPVLKGAGKELASGRYIPLLGDQHVDNLSELVDHPVRHCCIKAKRVLAMPRSVNEHHSGTL